MFPDIKWICFSCVYCQHYWRHGRICSARKYTKYISWDILITIACAFAISKAMVNSGVADSAAKFIIGLSDDYGSARVACNGVYYHELVYGIDNE